MRRRRKLLEKLPLLIVLGLLAGAVGGAGIGMVQMKTSSSSTSTASK